jgi:Tfp pilus assembly protein PilO
MFDHPALVWNAVTTFLIAPLAWFVKGALDRATATERELRNTREALLRDYPTRAELASNVEQLVQRFDRLEAKLDRVLMQKAER